MSEFWRRSDMSFLQLRCFGFGLFIALGVCLEKPFGMTPRTLNTDDDE